MLALEILVVNHEKPCCRWNKKNIYILVILFIFHVESLSQSGNLETDEFHIKWLPCKKILCKYWFEDLFWWFCKQSVYWYDDSLKFIRKFWDIWSFLENEMATYTWFHWTAAWNKIVIHYVSLNVLFFYSKMRVCDKYGA